MEHSHIPIEEFYCSFVCSTYTCITTTYSTESQSVRERKRERQTDRKRETDRQTERERETDRQTDSEKERERPQQFLKPFRTSITFEKIDF